MKIAQVISDTNIGGAGVLLASIVSGLKDEFDIEVILPSGSLLSARFPHGIGITELPTSADRSISRGDVAIFAEHFRKSRPDVIHTHASFGARLAGKLSCGSICCSTRHCSQQLTARAAVPAYRRMLYNLCTDVTVSTADFATRDLIREGVPAKRIITIKNGSPDLSVKLAGTPSPSLRELGIPEDALILGSVARLEPIKGQDLILRAAPEIISRFKNAFFLFLGEGSMMNEYKKLAAALGIEKRVRFLGFVDTPGIYQRLFRLNINSSRGTETSCLATSECLSLGIPTVASDFGGNPEMIENGKNGYLFSSDNPHALADAVVRILGDSKLYGRLCDGARKSYVENFSVDRMIDRYRALYAALERSGKQRTSAFFDKIRAAVASE